ncbi:Ig-like domain-containing protein [Herbiconiux sp. CPCC 203407]|uniref:Ig-like domain-containing protein n=1 Tax=Herbiconiux oxytropis TaxID=2970915 RepID=A0AA41XDW9_9MICO|nr:Ig-like domain-containing protein [Herbiconiux oxytropis]MCS5722587.1 Ig-like domain-containing protein [Herbiconiux oxytropis]MCS5726399.1 Ig-like domain-containing protein [Herbiconiux oxytropis]
MRSTRMISRSGAGAWLRGRRSLVTTLVSSAALVAVVATTAFVSTGYTAQKVELDDGAVWLTSDLHQAAGRANPQVGLLNAAVRMESGSLDVAQRGQTVVVSDLGGGEARLVDTANAEVSDTFSLPIGDATVELGDGVAVLSSTTSGDVWVADPAALAAFDPQSAPDLTLGAGGSALLGSTGSLFAVSSATGSVFTRADPASGAPTGETIDAEPGDRLSLTAVGDRWVVYDHDERRLFTREGDFDLSGSVGADDGVWLQRPSAAGGSVLLATGGALLEVSLADGIASTRSEGHSGTSVGPVQVEGCWYAAWTDGRSWARCDGVPVGDENEAGAGADAGVESTREASASGDELVFRTDGAGGVLLSDRVTGRAWDVTRQNALIDGWEELLPEPPADEESDDVVTDEPVETDPAQRPPVAGDDELGARPGRTTVLPVLLNDYDPNGDVVVIDGTVVAPDAGWTVDAIADSQQLQITLPPEASGEVAFAYTISDGRGGTDDATVRVQVRADAENSAPVQSTTPRLDVALGGRGEVDIRADWFDPDGDAFYLLQASTASPDAVSFTPEGVLTFTDSGQGTGQKEVSVTVSDGVSSTAGTVVVGVHEAADVPLRAEGFVAFVHVGQELEVDPLAHVTGGGSGLRLAGVPAHEGYGLAPDYAGGTLRITADTVGEGLVDYAVSDGSKTASGVIRVIAELPPDASTRPVTVPHAAFARQNSSVDVDVLASDFDPAGGVLMVTAAAPVAGAGAEGLRVEVIEQRLLRITLTRPLETGGLSVTYTITNGLAEASGSVGVVEIPEPAVRQPPVATADSASVRVGDVVDIPVLANDSQPDGDALSLNADLVRPLAADAGLLFTSGSVLRYLAPSTPGDFTAEYRVDAPDGQWSTATVTMSVREADPTVNAAPVPPLVTARVVAGETVRIPVPVAGIDPDGDSVQFVGIDSVPEKGAVADSGSDWIDYTAGDYSTGTDTFGYTVVDRLGARATGTVRVGVGARAEGARNPVAAPDEVLVRPGKSVLVRVLENDSDPEGSALTVTAVEPLGDGSGPAAVATVVEGGMLSVETPAEPGRYGFLYTVANERGGTGSSFATVDVRPDAPLARPLVSDTVLTLSDILDSDTVDVDVRENVFFAEGGAGELWLSVLPAYARVAEVVGGEVRVSVRPERQVIPFTLAHPDDPDVRSTGFIWVPGQDDALPQLRKGAPRLSVESGRALRIPLAEQVVAIGGDDVVIADPNSVRATHADGGALTSGAGTLVYRSSEGYFGPASISFEVADGTGPDARTATLVLPITVTPRENQPPVFAGAVLEVEPGARRVVDLAKLTTSTSGAGDLAFQLLEPRSAGFGTVLLGQQLTITADPDARLGTTGALSIGVSSGSTAGKPGRISLTVVASTRPVTVPADDTVIAPRGTTTTIDVLANDEATNPFPESPLTVTAVRGVDTGSLPAGLTVTPSADRRQLRITAAADAPPSDVAVQYQVLDATRDPQRAAWGTVRIAVQDRPGPVGGLAVTGFGDRSVDVVFSPGASNNSSITGFTATARSVSGGTVSTACASTRCAVRTPGNGPGEAVTIGVTATNNIGVSEPTAYASPIWSDLLPTAPGALQLAPRDGALEVRWSPAAVGAGGSPVRQYDVSAGGSLVETVDAAGAGCDGAGCSSVVRGLTNGSPATVTVTARNDAFPALAVWASSSATATPFGAPASSTVTAVTGGGLPAGTVTLSWAEFPGNGDAVAGYFVQRLTPGTTAAPGGAQACTVTTPAPGRVVAPSTGGAVVEQLDLGQGARSAVFSGLTAVDTSYPFVVWGYNAAGCTPSAVVSAMTVPSPGVVDTSRIDSSMVQQGAIVDLQLRSVPTTSPVTSPRYWVQQVDAGGAPVGSAQSFTLGGFPRAVTNGAFGEAYRYAVRVCDLASGIEVCTPYSAPLTAPAPSLTFEFGSAPVYDGTSWSWLSDPPNGSLVPEYSCGSTAAAPPTPESGSGVVIGTTCTPPAPAPQGEDAWLQLSLGGYEFVYFG